MKKPVTPLTLGRDAELENLYERLRFVEARMALPTPRDNQDALNGNFTLIVDMIHALERYGAILDETIQRVDPKDAWRGYVKMWAQAEREVSEYVLACAKANDMSEKTQERLSALLSHREKVAWRLWQVQIRLGETVSDREICELLEVQGEHHAA